jgi:hypothetical protein
VSGQARSNIKAKRGAKQEDLERNDRPVEDGDNRLMATLLTIERP